MIAIGIDDLLAELLGLAKLAGAVGGESAAERLRHGERGVVHAQNTGAARNDMRGATIDVSHRGGKLSCEQAILARGKVKSTRRGANLALGGGMR
jgi:hypothetical protein